MIQMNKRDREDLATKLRAMAAAIEKNDRSLLELDVTYRPGEMFSKLQVDITVAGMLPTTEAAS